MEIFAGVDGGGTKTRLLLYDLYKDRAVMLDGGPSRLTLLGPDACTELLVNLLERGVQRLGGKLDNLLSVSFCLSGIDTVTQSRLMHERLSVVIDNAVIEVVNDAFSVLSAGTLDASGLAVIGGTGSIAVGQRHDGVTSRAGGLGSIIGDEGSGFDIGRRGLSAAVRGFEGRGPATKLWGEVAERYGIYDALGLVDHIYEGENQVTKVAGFAPVVLELAEHDEVAAKIVASAAESYVQLIKAVRRQLRDDLGRRVILSGGLFQNYDVIPKKLHSLLPEDEFLITSRPPVLGALMRAIGLYRLTCPGNVSKVSFMDFRWADQLTIQNV
ncbi:N-acetylglucosamine kinase [Alicyclobacillus ferrooxydans]|uniref:N-acetylglucosamine kinase n=1 Tax=Alicyclobacillus ferrooxydans TaxID=471514 RepID=UPI0006D542EF|nr:BadF/BadG/BcrA/BcrD ATPase family protein [Alicyclobacillus ferrooxydans]